MSLPWNWGGRISEKTLADLQRVINQRFLRLSDALQRPLVQQIIGGDEGDFWTTNFWVSSFWIDGFWATLTGAGTSPYVDPKAYLVEVDATNAAATVYLPALATFLRDRLILVKSDSSANAVTITPNGSETINGSGSATLSSQYDALILYPGSEWFIGGSN